MQEVPQKGFGEKSGNTDETILPEKSIALHNLGKLVSFLRSSAEYLRSKHVFA